MLSELFQIYLPIADYSVSVATLILIGLFIGFLAGMFGLGGGLIGVPILISIGIDPQVAVASSANQMTAASCSSFLGYARRHRVDYRLGSLMLIGGMSGAIIGVFLLDWLSEIGQLDITVSGCFLFILGINTLLTGREGIHIYKKSKDIDYKRPARPLWIKKLSLPLHRAFISSHKEISVFSPVIIGLIGGILVSLLGIGGTLVIVPTMLYLLRVSASYTAGTTHFQLIFTTIVATIMHSVTNHSIDIILSSILIIGTVFGAQIGVRFGTTCGPERFKVLLSGMILIMCIHIAYGLLVTPASLYAIELVK